MGRIGLAASGLLPFILLDLLDPLLQFLPL